MDVGKRNGVRGSGPCVMLARGSGRLRPSAPQEAAEAVIVFVQGT
ncbi:MAG TPA: hypothetical protein VN520_30175 [Streptomyces sp.]|nr:hypothetical protein [Streptomyces sp.]HWU10581.1 hypothetical protein [Streptomyces sp.]